MNRLHVVAQFTFRIVPTVAYTTGDSSQLWLCHERLPPKSSLASFNSANLSWATLRAGQSKLYHPRNPGAPWPCVLKSVAWRNGDGRRAFCRDDGGMPTL